ncbi:MAG: peptide chain release factor N(5)-glutamine methyltransferase [Brumimicrobium sp.]
MATVNDILSQFKSELNDSFTQNEKQQIAKMFLMNRMNLSMTDIILKRNEDVPKHDFKEILRDIHRINRGKPVQYVLGVTYFYGLELITDERALIPRPETEELVNWIIEIASDRSPKLLDVGTGSGCIPLAVKANLPNSDVRGIDYSQDAIDLANENAKKLGLTARFEIGSALNLEDYSKYKWDIIVSNPPYIPYKDKKNMQSHVVEYEPEIALFVPDKDPLMFYKDIAKYAKEYLVPNGHLFFEINENYAKEVKEVLTLLGFSEIELKKDLQGKDRMIKAKL